MGAGMSIRSGGSVRTNHRSECVINQTVEMLGDQWTLLVIRDIIFVNRRHFRELLTQSMEGIASNILADRLRRLVQQGIITRSDDPTHKQKAIYSLTEKGIALVPLLLEMAAWGHEYLPAATLHGRARALEEGGPERRAEFMNELRKTHLPASGAETKTRRPKRSARIPAMRRPLSAHVPAPTKRKK
jgi:DNA-binding HxlR family transcriptional regulator